MKRAITNNPASARWALVSICLACVILIALSCSKNKTSHARRLLDGLPPELVRHLISSDDSTLACFGRETGFEALHSMNNQIGRRELDLWTDGRRDDARVVGEYNERLARVFSTVYQDESYSADVTFLRGIPESKRDEVIRVRCAYIPVQLDASLSPEEALETHARYVGIFDSLGDGLWAAMGKLNMSDAYERLGDHERHKQYLIAACSDFRELGRNKMACETLGRLGSRYERWGQPDSMEICYEQALEIAYRGRMGYQAARILEFYAGHYGRLGRLDVKRRLLEKAIDVARVYDPGCYEVRFLKEAMRFHANLGCWEVVENLITQVRGLEGKCENLEIYYSEIDLLRTDVYEAQVRMAFGDTARADEILRDVNRRLANLKLSTAYRSEDDQYSYYRAQGLLSNGRPRDALEEARKKLSQPPEESIPLWSARLSMIAAKSAYRTGQLDTALQALRDFDRFAVGEENELRTELSERDALVGMVGLARGDTAGAVEAVANGLRKLREAATSVDASVGSYLWLTDSDELRQVLHDVTAGDELAGYGAEFYWREMYDLLGAKERVERGSGAASDRASKARLAATPSGETLIDEFRSVGRTALEGISRLDAVHSVYLVRDKDIWRWTATRGGVSRDVLNASPEEMRRLVASTRKMLSTYPADPATPADEQLRENLRTLARTLLPVEVLEANTSPSMGPFLVTTDNFLGTIPFETFDIGRGGDYEPLLSHRDVAYVRHVHGDAPRETVGPGVILANREPARTYRGGAQRLRTLREVEEEGKALAQLDKSAIFLMDDYATKRRLTALWEKAPYIYIAGHTISDVPYLATIILVDPAGDMPPDKAVLDVTDIRAADLRRCGVVVLSGCSSGSPYIAARGAGPSLGDAFLDAGAGAVVHTFWDVKDEDARRIGTSFINGWKNTNASEVRALADARRGEIRGPKGIRHPSCWANYAITISRF
jgi:tetratricopeptide (TPR) repeat protein